jgi:hypothetical protein
MKLIVKANLKKSDVACDTSIKRGDKVKSYDFPENLELDPERAERNYVVGTVTDIVEEYDCEHYKILVEYRVVSGDKQETPTGQLLFVYPPVNGTLTWTDKTTCGVVKV